MNSTNLNISLKFVFAFILFATVFQSRAKASGAGFTCSAAEAQYYAQICVEQVTATCDESLGGCNYACVQEFKPYIVDGVEYDPDPYGDATKFCEGTCNTQAEDCYQGVSACVAAYCAANN